MTRVLVCAAHPDDEIIGLGGTVARHADDGDTVRSLILAEGESSRGNDADTRTKIEALKDCARSAAAILGSEPPEFAEFPDNRMDEVALLDVVHRIEETMRSFEPALVYTHSAVDVNVDHRVVHDAVLAACRPQPGNPVREVRLFETASSTEWRFGADRGFTPTTFVDVTATLRRKLRALECYEPELRPWPHPRSIRGIENLARSRGSTVGVEAAEAFELCRRIV